MLSAKWLREAQAARRRGIASGVCFILGTGLIYDRTSDQTNCFGRAEGIIEGGEPTPNPLARTIAFTGRLAAMKRAEAFALVRTYKGTPRRGVTRKTDILVVGELGWPLLANGDPSHALRLANSYGVPTVAERRFLEWAGRAIPDQYARTFTVEQIVSLSNLPKEVIDLLVVFGLLDQRSNLFGFRDLAAARQTAALFAAGVKLSTLTASLHDIKRWLPDVGLANLRLSPLTADALLVEHLSSRTDTTGQFLLPVNEASDNPDEVFEQAQAAQHAGDTVTAERLYRRVINVDPGDAVAPFNLGNVFREAGRRTEAESLFRTAVETDPLFAQAWYNLAALLDDRGRLEEAIACLKTALDVDPDYADAMFNLAFLFQRLGQYWQAASYWRGYLAKDGFSHWASQARKALKLCEMQPNMTEQRDRET